MTSLHLFLAWAALMRLNFRGPHVDQTTLGGSCRVTCRTYRSAASCTSPTSSAFHERASAESCTARSLGKKLRWNRLQKPQHETAKQIWDSMVGIHGIQWDSMGFNGIHDVSAEIGLASRLCDFHWPCQGNLDFVCKRPEPNADPDSRG